MNMMRGNMETNFLKLEALVTLVRIQKEAEKGQVLLCLIALVLDMS